MRALTWVFALALLAGPAGGAAAAVPAAPVPIASSGPSGQAAPRPPRTIHVSGEGRVSVAPDVALFSVGVDALGKTVSAATAEANAKMRAVLDALAKAGVASKDVRTTRYDVSIDRPWKDGKPGPITGYRVSTAAEAKVRDLGRLGAILDQVTSAGSNALGALRMDRDDPSPERLKALAAAYASARAKAEALARAAGVELGEVLAMSEGSAPVPRPLPMVMMRAASADGEVPVAEGEQSFGAQVEVTFAIR